MSHYVFSFLIPYTCVLTVQGAEAAYGARDRLEKKKEDR